MSLVARLAEHKTLAGLPEEEYRWLVEHGTLQRHAAGTTVSRKDQPLDEMYIVLDGLLSFFVERGGERRKVIEWRPGDVSGVLPYSRLRFPPGNGLVEESLETLTIHRSQLPDLIRQCPATTERLVHVMLDRARLFQSSELQDEKMASLGKLSAGLAHELNNPASAAARSARLLREALAESDEAAHALGAIGLTEEQQSVLENLRERCANDPVVAVLSPLERADREDEVTQWLEEHGADPAHAAALAASAVSVDALDRLEAALGSGTGRAGVDSRTALDTALRWIAVGCTARSMAADIERAASRVHELVSAVKRFTYMDRATTAEPTAIGPGISDTLALLAPEARKRSVSISLDLQDDLPLVRALGGELNQVWLNLLDNAIDAAPDTGDGRIEVQARREGDSVVVRIRDNGQGIPADVQSRIFDPFFTTKPVGEGTGIGLDIARRIVRRHDGAIDFSSKPGQTEFCVRFPVFVPTVGSATEPDASH